jgi:hypothetical protein
VINTSVDFPRNNTRIIVKMVQRVAVLPCSLNSFVLLKTTIILRKVLRITETWDVFTVATLCKIILVSSLGYESSTVIILGRRPQQSSQTP